MITFDDVRGLAERVHALPGVRAVGITKPELSAPGEGDVDMTVYCETVPAKELRAEVYPEATIELFSGERWGVGDLVTLGGVEVFVMYFTCASALEDARSILAGNRERVESGGFYTTGRLAMYKNLVPLADDGFIGDIKRLCENYPDALAESIISSCEWALNDAETFERAVMRREVLLYHAELDKGMDALLQELFALNRVLFPSRKRSLLYLEGFAMKPVGCGERLLEIVKLGADAETIPESYEKWKALVAETEALKIKTEI